MSHLLRQRDQKRLLLGSKYIGALNITSLVYLLHPLFRLVLNSEELNTEEPYFVVTAICCQVWLATGSDLGGSLRTPASFCGVVGLRPSVGRVPQGNSLHQPAAKGKLQLHAVSGPMARNVPDLALFWTPWLINTPSQSVSLPRICLVCLPWVSPSHSGCSFIVPFLPPSPPPPLAPPHSHFTPVCSCTSFAPPHKFTQELHIGAQHICVGSQTPNSAFVYVYAQ